MNLDKVADIARAVLYEGFILYPYRPSSLKNRQRWTFGGLYPETYARRGGGDASRQRVQCLVEGGSGTTLEVRMRCLQLVERSVGRLEPPLTTFPAWVEPVYTLVEALEIGGRRYCSWQEAMEREVTVPATSLGDLCAAPLRVPFHLAAARQVEPLLDGGIIAAILIRERRAVSGAVTVSAERVGPGLFRVTVVTENLTALPEPAPRLRDAASLYSLASTHIVLGAGTGEFVSLIDPPPGLQAAANACRNSGAFPVLVGEPGERDTLLAAPIILYDYPAVAPESPGDLFDATEIDEMLTLRIMTMTAAERREAAAEPRAAALLARTDSLTPEDLQRLHGTLRSMRTAGEGTAAGLPRFSVGDRVRLQPRRGGDVIDLALIGRTAVIEAIETDFEDRVHVAVTVECDPGREFGLERMPGHRFFFAPEELEPAADAAGRARQ